MMNSTAFAFIPAFGIIFILLAIALAIFIFVFWLLMLIDCLKRKFKSSGEQIAWILVLIFVHVIGALIYYFAVYRK